MNGVVRGGLIVAAMAVALAGGVAARNTAGESRAAHHPIVECITSSTWLIGNSEKWPGGDMAFTTSAGHAGSVPPGGSTEVAFSGDKLTVHGSWSNGVQESATGSNDCAPPDTDPPATTTTEPATTTTEVPPSSSASTTTTIPDTSPSTSSPATSTTSTSSSVGSTSTTTVASSTSTSPPVPTVPSPATTSPPGGVWTTTPTTQPKPACNSSTPGLCPTTTVTYADALEPDDDDDGYDVSSGPAHG